MMVKAVKAMKRSIEEIGYNIISIREIVSGLTVFCYFIYSQETGKLTSKKSKIGVLSLTCL
jgi:hypothetical protein